MTITDINAPPLEPVSLAGAKEFLRVDHDHEDGLIADMIRAARQRIEEMARASLITRRRLFTTSRVCVSGVRLNHGPIKQIHKVSVIEANENIIDIALSDLRINLRASPANILVSKRELFSDYAADPCALSIEFDGGYGAEKDQVPMQLRQAILLLVAQHYEHRDEAITRPVPMLVDALLMPYREVRL